MLKTHLYPTDFFSLGRSTIFLIGFFSSVYIFIFIEFFSFFIRYCLKYYVRNRLNFKFVNKFLWNDEQLSNDTNYDIRWKTIFSAFSSTFRSAIGISLSDYISFSRLTSVSGPRLDIWTYLGSRLGIFLFYTHEKT